MTLRFDTSLKDARAEGRLRALHIDAQKIYNRWCTKTFNTLSQSANFLRRQGVPNDWIAMTTQTRHIGDREAGQAIKINPYIREPEQVIETGLQPNDRFYVKRDFNIAGNKTFMARLKSTKNPVFIIHGVFYNQCVAACTMDILKASDDATLIMNFDGIGPKDMGHRALKQFYTRTLGHNDRVFVVRDRSIRKALTQAHENVPQLEPRPVPA